MPPINTVYLISHTHTDIGYTDHQDTVFRQHVKFIDQAIELCEATADYPEAARYRWTCEVAAIVEHYLQESPARQVDRFLALHRQGRIAVAAMAYHWTPMLSPANMLRSLYPAMRLRRQYGLRVTSAMQCDVDGAGWLWADLLPAAGITGLTMSINMHRGARPQPDLSPFWWEGPGGGRLLTYNGPHYIYGIFRYGLGDFAAVERLLPAAVERLEQHPDYSYDFVYAQVTHPARVDNGPPYEPLSDFVRRWNESDRSPRMQFVTVDDFLAILHERYGSHLPTWRGDWADWWADGVASSAYETALNRSTEALLPALDLLAAQTEPQDDLIEEAYRLVSLYDEHTWGAFASIRRPHSPFTQAQWNGKASFAYKGFSLTHELLARTGRQLARKLSGALPEGDVWRQWGQYVVSDPSAEQATYRFLVINSLAWTRRVRWPLPPDLGGAAPHAFLEAFLVGDYRDRPPLETQTPPDLLIETTLPPFGYEVVAPVQVETSSEARVGEGILENQWYHIEVDPVTGGLSRWYDKELDRELAAQQGPWRLGQYLYEWVDHPEGRRAIFALDFNREDFGVRHKDTPFRRQGAFKVEITPAHLEPAATSIELRLQAPGARSVRVCYSLPHHEKALYLDMVIDKEHCIDPEAVYIMFPFALEQPKFHLDLNGVPLEPEAEQLPGSCRDWYGIQRWAEVTDGVISVVVVPVDAPLVQVGGIQTGRWASRLEAHQATLVSWPVHNHWDTNFKASQGGELLFRYRLTSLPGYDPAAASRFAAEALLPPIIVRVPGATPGPAGQFLQVEPEGVADLHLKRAADGRGVILHAFNLTAQAQTLTVRFPATPPTSAWTCSPIEEDGSALFISGGAIPLAVPPRSVACARVIFD
jgi:alpha-mannosidase